MCTHIEVVTGVNHWYDAETRLLASSLWYTKNYHNGMHACMHVPLQRLHTSRSPQLSSSSSQRHLPLVATKDVILMQW